MKARAIIHQQICQLRWRLLACLGLIMVLPIEEATVSFREGNGFYSVNMAIGALIIAPLLVGLIACSNVQADLNEKRYIFWRSKPAGVRKLMALKFVVGLIISFAIIVCPLIFAVVTSTICGEDLDDPSLKFFVPTLILIAMMTYSLCFGCNVLVRNTARSWLIGMLLTGFILIIPFILPFGITDIQITAVAKWAFVLYTAVILAISALAFVCSLLAAQQDWHLRTNLKGLLYVGAGVVFILLMLFSSQVANIKVSDEMEIGAAGWSPLAYLGKRVVLDGGCYVNTNRNKISLSHIISDPNTKFAFLARPDTSVWSVGYIDQIYPDYRYGGIYKEVGNDVYSLTVYAYFRSKEKSRYYEKVYIRSQQFSLYRQPPASELDISDCLVDGINWLRIAARLIDNTLVVCVNDSLIVVDVTDPGEMKLIDKKLHVLSRGSWYLDNQDRQKEFAVPLVPVDKINIEQRIKLSIDLSFQYDYGENYIYKSSIVDIHDDKIAFFCASDRDVARFDVTKWDEKKIYCKFRVARPFTILEAMLRPHGNTHDRLYVENQKLYAKQGEQLMVFDVSSNRRVRKLGHFVRMDWKLEDLAVLENGNVLLCASWDNPGRNRRDSDRKYLYLLENPE